MIMRNGKTARDRQNGAHGRNETNKSARAEWSRAKGKSGSKDDFPYETCNGKKAYRRK